MTPELLSLGGFSFERKAQLILLRTPDDLAETDLQAFLRGAGHLLTLGMDLEGQVELSGGLIIRIEGEWVRLKLGRYSETFPTDRVAALFERLTTELAPDPQQRV